jgi:hypothetical protein
LADPDSEANMTVHQIIWKPRLLGERCVILPMMSDTWVSTGIRDASAAFDAARSEVTRGGAQ